MQSMDELFYAVLQDVYGAEREQLGMLATLAEMSANDTLKLAFRDHEDETLEHVARLEEVFEIIGREPHATPCAAMAAMVAQARTVTATIADGALRDAAMVAACQAVEHYEIARYATLAAWAEHLGDDDVIDLLSETLDEERHADEILSSIADGGVNATASERADAAPV